MEAIALHSNARHGANNLQYESVVLNAMDIIESDQDFVRLLNRMSTIVQGDDPDWQDVSFDDFDESTIACRESIQVGGSVVVMVDSGD